MKKILISSICMVITIYVKAQLFPNTATQNNTSTLFKPIGGVTAGVGFILTNYYDTTAANSINFLKNYAGATFFSVSDNAQMVRNKTATGWLKQASGVIPAQFNPIAGTNMTINGSYPNITFSSRAVAVVGTVGGGNPDDPTAGTGSYQNNKLIGLGANLTIIIDGNVFVNYGNNSSFTFSSVTGTVSGIRWISGSSVFITLNQ